VRGAGAILIEAWLVLAQLPGSPALPPTCHGFINPGCCCTHDCCWPIPATDLDSLPFGQWRIKATGQEMKQTGWSPDGQYWRCACRHTGKEWVRDVQARTSCLYVPPQFM